MVLMSTESFKATTNPKESNDTIVFNVVVVVVDEKGWKKEWMETKPMRTLELYVLFNHGNPLTPPIKIIRLLPIILCLILF